MSTYRVIETPHSSPNNARSIAEFATRHEALIASAKSTKAHLTELSVPGLNAKELFNRWLEIGNGYRIEPEDSDAPFSDVDYARLFVMRLTNDYSHPLFIEVSTVDCLRTASGVNSPSKQWKFYIKAPSTYDGDGLEALLKAATALLYDDMSRQSQAADGSTYVMLEMNYRTASEEEALAAIKADSNATVYFVQNDGSFGRSMPINPMTAAR